MAEISGRFRPVECLKSGAVHWIEWTVSAKPPTQVAPGKLIHTTVRQVDSQVTGRKNPITAPSFTETKFNGTTHTEESMNQT